MITVNKDGFLVNEKAELVDNTGKVVEQGVLLKDVKEFKFFTDEDLKKIRSDEKGKLYEEIEKSKEAVETLTTQFEDVSKQFKDTVTKLTQTTALLDDEKTQKEILEEKGKTKDEIISDQVKDLRDEMDKTKDALKQEELKRQGLEKKLLLERYTVDAIRKAGGESELIVDLIGGNSEAEIDKSIENSKNKRIEIRDIEKNKFLSEEERKKKAEEVKVEAERVKKEADEKTAREIPSVSVIPGGTQEGGEAIKPIAVTSDDIKTMSNEDFEKNRDKMEAQIKKNFETKQN